MRQSVQFAQSLAKHIPGLITGVRVLQDDVTVITSPSKICGLLRYLRDSPTTEFRGLMESLVMTLIFQYQKIFKISVIID